MGGRMAKTAIFCQNPLFHIPKEFSRPNIANKVTKRHPLILTNAICEILISALFDVLA